MERSNPNLSQKSNFQTEVTWMRPPTDHFKLNFNCVVDKAINKRFIAIVACN